MYVNITTAIYLHFKLTIFAWIYEVTTEVTNIKII